MLQDVLAERRPDLVHVHELAGLPSSVLEVIHRHGVPMVVTLQDYFPVCSTFKLLDASGQICTRLEIGDDCAATTAADPRSPGLLIEATIQHEARRAPLGARFEPVYSSERFGRVAEWLGRARPAAVRAAACPRHPPHSSGGAS